MTACVASTAGFHPEIVPSSVTNRKMAWPEWPPEETTKSALLPLNAVPVGAAVPVIRAGPGWGTAHTQPPVSTVGTEQRVGSGRNLGKFFRRAVTPAGGSTGLCGG